MNENDIANLDLEYKRYLQLLRPYLGQLKDNNVIKICDSWIQRLSNCEDDEKTLRNKYVFALCYQLARGVLDLPFLNSPPVQLLPLAEDVNSDDSSNEADYWVINKNEPKTKVLYDCPKHLSSETNYSQEEDRAWSESVNGSDNHAINQTSGTCLRKTAIFNNNPKMSQNMHRVHNMEYEFRANNLVKKLREIKMQNVLLHQELLALKEESKLSQDDLALDYVVKVDNATSPFLHSNESSATLKSLKYQLQEIQDSRNSLIQTISELQDQLDQFNEIKKNEIEKLEASHKLAIIKIRTDVREEAKTFYENKIQELKQTYEDLSLKIQETANKEIEMTNKYKEDAIFEKTKLLASKDIEIDKLKNQMEAQKGNIQSMLTKFMEKSSEDSASNGLKIKNQLLEKRLNKIERSKLNCTKIYEAKLSQVQREKQLVECSLQLQLVRQRAQVVSELTEENQTELNSSLEKLENKYKDIVANVQQTAIQRRMQDQRALESLLQTACSISDRNQSQYSSPVRNNNQTYVSENSSLPHDHRAGNAFVNKSFDNDSIVAGFCLNGERMGELFERLYIPQRDNCNTESK